MGIQVSGDRGTVQDLKAAGASPAYCTIWLGPWTRVVDGRVPDLAAHLEVCRGLGVLPFVQFFMAGDQVTEAFFDGGVTTTRGADLGRWWTLVKAAGATLGAQAAVVNLELEWFKATLQDGAPRFDQAWADAASTLRSLARNVQVANCPGEWASGAQLLRLYPKACAATDVWAVQNLRCLTRDPAAKYAAGPDALLARLKDYAAAFPGKPLMVTDLAYSTYGGDFDPAHPFLGGDPRGADALQRAAWDRLMAVRPQMEAAGVKHVIVRSMRDVDMDDVGNWYGAGEDCWGLARRDGSAKPARPAMLAFASAAPPAPAVYTEAQMQDAVRACHAAAASATLRAGKLEERLDDVRKHLDSPIA